MKKMSGAALSALLSGCLASGSSFANALITANVASGYSDCSLTDNGDGTSTASVTIDFNAAEGNTGDNAFLGRGLLFNFYDKNGVPQITHPIEGSLDGHASQGFWGKTDYVLIHGHSGSWYNDQATRMRAEVRMYNRMLAAWPGLVIRAANYVVGNDVAEISGGPYITATANGTCRLVKDPASPPPFDINISIDVPDWDLGEIQPGEQWIPLASERDRLCLRYTDAETDAKPFIINASNQNGVADRHYQLKNPDASSQTIPYQLILENGSLQVLLPNESGVPTLLDQGGRTCFSPLFRTVAPKTIQQGDYSDVLTFTVVTPT